MRWYGYAGEDIRAGQLIGRLPGEGVFTIATPDTVVAMDRLCVAVHAAMQGQVIAGETRIAALTIRGMDATQGSPLLPGKF